MVSPLLALLVPALLSTPSSGGSYVVGTFDTPAEDSAAVRRVYQALAYSNPATNRGLAVGADGALSLSVTLAADAGKDRSARAGILVPLNSLWIPKDIRTATAITFRIKGSSTYNVNFALGSYTYANAHDGVMMVAPVKVTSNWTPQSIGLAPTTELRWLSWMEDEERFPGGTAASVIMDSTDPLYNDETRNVAMSLRHLEFQIDPSWLTATTWTTPAAGVTTLSVDDIVVVGWNRYPEVHGRGCDAGRPSIVYSDLKSSTNSFGAGWFAYADTGAWGLAKGASSIVLPDGAKDWTIDTALAEAHLVANLERSAANRHAGFAGIGIQVEQEHYFYTNGMTSETFWGTGPTYLDLTGLEAMSFTLDVPPGASIDPDRVAGVHFKVGMNGVGDSATHEVMIPARQFAAGRVEICVDVGSLKMPDWMLYGIDYRQFSPGDVITFAWEIRLEDSANAILSARNQGFKVGPLVLYGLSSIPDPVTLYPLGNSERGPGRQPFSVSYRSGQLSLEGLEGYASLEVRTLSGARIATVAPAAVVKIRLDRGAYLLVARGAGKPALSRTLAVAR
jgi:hypothetical protein